MKSFYSLSNRPLNSNQTVVEGSGKYCEILDIGRVDNGCLWGEHGNFSENFMSLKLVNVDSFGHKVFGIFIIFFWNWTYFLTIFRVLRNGDQKI